MISVRCQCGATYDRVRVLPVHCRCGRKAGEELATRRQGESHHRRAFGSILRELVGCGCNLPCRKWDRRGLDWCRDNAEQIAQRLTAEPRPAIPIDRARELVQQALRIAERSAETPQPPPRSQLSPDP